MPSSPAEIIEQSDSYSLFEKLIENGDKNPEILREISVTECGTFDLADPVDIKEEVKNGLHRWIFVYENFRLFSLENSDK